LKNGRLFILLIVLALTGCNSISKTDQVNQSIWDKVVDKEYSNYDAWAGTGFNFYEIEGERYCTFLIYGSGVPVAYHYTTKVRMDDGRVILSLPKKMDATETIIKDNKVEVSDVTITVGEGFFMMGDTKFVESEGMNSMENILKE